MLRGILFAVLAWVGVGILVSFILPLLLDGNNVNLSAVGAQISALSLIFIAPIAFFVGYWQSKRKKAHAREKHTSDGPTP